MRTIEGIDGPIEVPADPQRVVALYGDADLDALIALGVAPVAVGNFAAQEASPGDALVVVPWLADAPQIEGATMIPVLPQINLEMLAAQRPDLIIYNSTVDPPAVDAPTILMDVDDGFNGSLQVVARAVGRETEADRLIAELDARIESMAGTIDTGRTVSIAYAYDLEVIGVYNPLPVAMVSGAQLAERVGLLRPEAQRGFTDEMFTELSLEQVDQLDADVMLLIYGDDAQATSALEVLNANPVWRALLVVQRGDVIPVGIHWERRGSLLAAHAVLDDIERLFPRA